MTNAWRSMLTARGSLLFAALVALNVVWLVADARTTPDEASNVNAYGECRSAIRQARPQAARGLFPTLDLIRVSRADSARYTVRGFFQDQQRVVSTWYTWNFPSSCPYYLEQTS